MANYTGVYSVAQACKLDYSLTVNMSAQDISKVLSQHA